MKDNMISVERTEEVRARQREFMEMLLPHIKKFDEDIRGSSSSLTPLLVVESMMKVVAGYIVASCQPFNAILKDGWLMTIEHNLGRDLDNTHKFINEELTKKE